MSVVKRITEGLGWSGIDAPHRVGDGPGDGVVVDATALDTGHRARGIGRYVAGLVAGLDGLRRDGHLATSPVALRLAQAGGPAYHGVDGPQGPGDTADAVGQGLPTWRLRRPQTTHLLRFGLNELRLADELRGAGCRVFHATEPWAVPVGRGLATVVTIHDVIPLLFPERYMDRHHMQWRAYYTYMSARRRWSRFDRIIAISEATRATVIERLGVSPERVVVVPNGIDHAQFQPVEDPEVLGEVRDRLGLARPFVLYVGGYDWRKNIGTLVRAMRGLPQAELVLGGGMDAATRAGLDEVIRESGVADRVRFLGYVDDRDLPALYTLARAFAYPSIAEGFGLQLLEAMAHGCPVVTSDVSSLPEVAGDAALCVDPRDPEALGDALGRVLEDETLRERLRVAGHRRVGSFSWERCASETARVYEALRP